MSLLLCEQQRLVFFCASIDFPSKKYMSLGLGVWEKAKWIDMQRALLSLFEKERGAKTKRQRGAKERKRQAEQESLGKKAQKREPARHESVGAKKHKNKR